MSEKKDKWYLFDTDKAMSDLRVSDGFFGTTFIAAKLAGKKLFNATAITTGFVATEVLPAMTIGMAKKILSNDKATEEQKEQARETIARAEEYQERVRERKNDEND